MFPRPFAKHLHPRRLQQQDMQSTGVSNNRALLCSSFQEPSQQRQQQAAAGVLLLTKVKQAPPHSVVGALCQRIAEQDKIMLSELPDWLRCLVHLSEGPAQQELLRRCKVDHRLSAVPLPCDPSQPASSMWHLACHCFFDSTHVRVLLAGCKDVWLVNPAYEEAGVLPCTLKLPGVNMGVRLVQSTERVPWQKVDQLAGDLGMDADLGGGARV